MNYHHTTTMYIAFKWLFGLTFIMWITMCCLDTLTKKHFIQPGEGSKSGPLPLNMKNRTIKESIKSKTIHTERFIYNADKHYGMAYWHFFMFLAGALAVTAFNRIDEITIILMHAKREFANILTNENTKLLQEYSKITACAFNSYSITFFNDMYTKLKYIANRAKAAVRKRINLKMFQRPRVNLMLLKKLKEVGEERRNLAQLLIAALQENKNIRMQYQLESMAKKRLVRHIEKTEKLIKENRSRYVSFQQLYLVTHQENTFLKCRIKKLTLDKEEAEKDLCELLNEVFKSKNKELKLFCNRFIVKTKQSLLNTDANAEIQAFLKNSRGPVASCSSRHLAEQPDIEINKANSWLRCSSCSHITEFIKDNSIAPLVTEAPKLRGLPGEYVWTVKDKDGLIEKLYEYDYDSDYDAGDTIRRIREYSVYHDKDCLLDLSNSTTIVTEKYRRPGMQKSSCAIISDPVTNDRFLTGSEAFKQFMQRNENVVSMSLLPTKIPLSD